MRVRDEERRRAFAEQERARLLAQQQKEEEAARQRLLEQLAEKWQVSERIRAFVAESEKKLSPSTAENPGVTRWSAWARAYADSIDPIQSGLLRRLIGGAAP